MHSVPCPRCGGPTAVQASCSTVDEQALTCVRICSNLQCEHLHSTVEMPLERYQELCVAQYRLNQLRAWLNSPHATAA